MKTLRKINIIFSLILLGIGMSNSSIIVSGNTQGWDANIAVVFSTGGLGDQSYNDMANTGLLEARIAHNLSVSTVEPRDIPAINTNIETFAQDSEKDLIVAIGFSAASGINLAATAHPERNFILVDAVIDLPNVASITFKEHEGSFLVGAMAALTTNSNKLGFLGGMDIPLINRFGSGFEQGARWINPDITFAWAYSPDSANPWGDLAGGKVVAETMIANGIDIIFAAAGGTGLGVFEAAKEATDAGTKTYAIGVDSNQDHLKKGIVLTSMMKRVDIAVKSQIDSVVDGSWDNGTISLGLAEGGVGITPMEYTQSEANSVCGSSTRLEYVNSLAEFIIDGSIPIDETRQILQDRNKIPHGCLYATETQTVITETKTEVVTEVATFTITEPPEEATTTKTVEVTKTFSETKSEVGIYAPGIGGIIVLGVLTFLVRRRK